MKRIRMELSMEEAIRHAKKEGGWIAKQKGKSFWYPASYNMTEIMLDLPGKLEVGMWSHFQPA